MQSKLKDNGISHTNELVPFYVSLLAGVQPRWIQGDSSWERNQRPRKKLSYRYIERLETDSVVGKLVEKKRLNNLVYVE